MSARGSAPVPGQPSTTARHRHAVDEPSIPELPRRIPGAFRFPDPRQTPESTGAANDVADHRIMRPLATEVLQASLERDRRRHA
jgi:hypothetical protein